MEKHLQVERREVKIQPFGREEGGLGQSLNSQEKTKKGTLGSWLFPSLILFPESFAQVFPFRFRESSQPLGPNKYLLTPPPHTYSPPPPSWSATVSHHGNALIPPRRWAESWGPGKGKEIWGTDPGPWESGVEGAGKESPSLALPLVPG